MRNGNGTRNERGNGMAKLEDRIEEMVVSELRGTLKRERTELTVAILGKLVDEFELGSDEAVEKLETDVERGVNNIIDKLLKVLK